MGDTGDRRIDDAAEYVLALVMGGTLEIIKCRHHARLAALALELTKAGDLRVDQGAVRTLEPLHLEVVLLDLVGIDPDDRLLAALDLVLEGKRALPDHRLDEPGFRRRIHA